MDAIRTPFPYTETSAAEVAKQPTKEREKYLRRVPAVDQSVRLLFALAKTVSGEATLTELARDTDVSRSKALAVLNTLRFAGLVTRDDNTKRYRLGLNILILSRALINHTDLARETIPYLEELAAETGGSVQVGAILGEIVYVVAQRQAPGGMYMPIDVGTRYPVTFGAHGRVFLASLSPEDLESRLAQDSVLQPGQTDREAIDRDVLRAQVEDARRLGYGLSLGTTWSGMNAVAVALTVGSTDMPQERHAVACMVSIGRFSTERAHEIGRRMSELASEMSRKLDPLLRAMNVYFPEARSPIP